MTFSFVFWSVKWGFKGQRLGRKNLVSRKVDDFSDRLIIQFQRHIRYSNPYFFTIGFSPLDESNVRTQLDIHSLYCNDWIP